MLLDNVANYKKKNLAWAAGFVLALGLAYLLSWELPQGILSWLCSLPALGIVIITAVARLDDIKPEQHQKRWQMRRWGLMLTAIGAATVAINPIFAGWSSMSWRGAMLFWGFALTWLTTPEMPPWWRFITGSYKTKKVVAEVEIHVPKD